MDIEEIAAQIVDAAIRVHKAMGPGLFESAYQQCLAFELRRRGMQVACEVLVPIAYEGVQIESGYRADMIVENMVMIENKAVDEVAPIHHTQILTYLKLGGFKIGFLINWNVALLKDGIYRKVHPTYHPKWSKLPAN